MHGGVTCKLPLLKKSSELTASEQFLVGSKTTLPPPTKAKNSDIPYDSVILQGVPK